MKNPNWLVDELILALDLYISSGRRPPGNHEPQIDELSGLLNKFWSAETNKSASLRNSNGVRMKIMNFMRLDPGYTQSGRVGLTRGSKLEEVLWEEYANAPEKLSKIAHAIREGIAKQSSLEGAGLPLDDDSFNAEEGKILARMHFQRERNQKLVKAKKVQQLNTVGKLECEICGFDFYEMYGERGYGFIECHHISPLCDLPGATRTFLSMLRLVCSNCHRMLHSKKPWLSIEDLRYMIEERRNLKNDK